MRVRALLGVIVVFLLFVVSQVLPAASTPIASIHLTEGWATFGQVVPRGLAISGLQVGPLATQTDVKTRWDDGSIRFAVVTAQVPAAGTFDIAPGPSSPAGASPAPPSAEVRLNVYEEEAVEINNMTVGNPTHVTTSTPHGLTTGQVIYINWSTSTPTLNGPQQVTVIDPVTFSVPVDVEKPCDSTPCDVIAGRFVRPSSPKTMYVATLPPGLAGDQWLSGSNVNERRSVVTPVRTFDGIAHPFLRVIFDTRIYTDGQYRLDAIVENVLDKTGATTKWYEVDVRVDGVSRYTHAVGTMTSAPVEHYYLTRWRKTFDGGTGAQFSDVTPDLTPFNQARALPPYLEQIADLPDGPEAGNFDASPGYDILREGELRMFMPAHSGRPELAPFPDWTARYLVYKDQLRRELVMRHGDLSGSWPVHVRESEDSPLSGAGAGRLPSLAQRPELWYDRRANPFDFDVIKGHPMPVVESGSEIPDTGQTGLVPDTAHQPSMSFVPYLLSGDRYYSEEMEFWANYSMLRTYPGESDYQRGADGILWQNEVRGFGWALRNIADAAAYSPSTDVASYLGARVTANLAWLDQFVTDHMVAGNPFNVMWPSNFLRPEGTEYIAQWELSYLAHGIDRAMAHGFSGGATMRDAITDLRLRLFNSEPAYPRANAASVVLHIGDLWTDFFHPTIEDLAAANTNTDYHRPFAGYYGPESRMDLMIAIGNGRAGAQAAYDYLWPFIGEDPFGCAFGGPDRPDLDCRAGWAVDFYPAAPVVSADDDGDGINNAVDNCPVNPNFDQNDFDSDGAGDACDADDDNDTYSDADEIAAGSNPLNANSIPELCDGLDNDGDGIADNGLPNFDGDLFPDACDNDDDNDGASDEEEAAAGTDPFNKDISPEVCDGHDNDGDGISDDGLGPNSDGDLFADACDPDDDNDGSPDTAEIAAGSDPLDANSLPEIGCDGIDNDGNDGIDEDSPDHDNDGQADCNDLDDDNDTFADAIETAAGSNPLNAASTPEVCDGIDNDLNDGVDEGSLNTDGDSQADCVDDDDDNDTFSDAVEIAAGSNPLNAASTPEVCDGIDNDLNDGVDEGFANLDGDSLADCVDPDIDGDGRPNGVDPFPFIPNRAPSVDSPGAQTSTVGVSIASLPIAGVDLDGDGLLWSAAGLPEGLAIDQLGVVTGTPTAAAAGSHDVTIAVSDGLLGDSASFTWFVNNTPAGDDVTIDTPQVDITFDSVTQPGSTQVTPQPPPPPDQVPTGFSVAGLPAFDVTTTAQFTGPIVLCFDASSLSLDDAQFALLRVLHGEGGAFVDRTVLPNNFAAQTVCASVTALSPFALASVVAVNGAPSIDPIAPQTSPEDMPIAPLVITGSDPDGDSLTFTVTGLPQGLTGTPGTNNFTITGTPTQPGNFTVNVTLSDGTDSATTSFLWVVTAAPSQISLTNPGPQTDTEGDKVRLRLQFNAGKSGKKKHFNQPRFSADHLPPGLYIDRHDGVIFGHVSRRGEGVYQTTVTMRVKNEEVSQTFAWTILAKNHAPRIKHLDDQESRVGQAVNLKLGAFDQDDDDLTFSAVNLPPGLSVDPAGRIFGTPTGPGGRYRVVVTVSDGRGATDTCDFVWTIKAPKNHAPRIKHLDDQESKVGQPVNLTLSAFDEDDDDLVFSAVNLPPGLSIDPAGRIVGTPTGPGGRYRVVVKVSDGHLTDTCDFEWTIKAPKNHAPRIKHLDDRASKVGESVNLKLYAFDEDDDDLVFSAVNLPPGLSIDPAGRISGTPTGKGGDYRVVVKVSDGHLTDTCDFEWTIKGPKKK